MDGGHQCLLNAKGVVDDLGHGSQTVGGAGGIGDHIHDGGVIFMVDAHDKGGCYAVLGGGGDDDLFRAVQQVQRTLFRGVEGAGGLDDVLCAAVIPRNQGGIIFAVDADFFAIEDQVAVIMLDAALEGAEHRVVFYLVNHVVQICLSQVDAADLIGAAATFYHAAQSNSANTAKAVDTDFDGHRMIPSCFHIFCQNWQCMSLL